MKLKAFGLEDRCRELNEQAARMARSVCPPGRYVAGSIGPTGHLPDTFEPLGDTPAELFYESFREQALALAEGGVDLFAIETMMIPDEAVLAIAAVKDATGLPGMCSMTFQYNQARGIDRTMWGTSPADAAAQLVDAGADIVGCNCGDGGPSRVPAILAEMRTARLLWRDSTVDGIKTGHHSGAGYCLMASAKRGDQRLISVVMGSTSEEQRAVDSQALLNWGFRFFETHKLYDAGKAIATQNVCKGAADEVQLGVTEPLLVTVPRGKYAQLKPSMDVPKKLVAPMKKGQKIGAVKVMLDGKLAQRPLVALAPVEDGGFFKRLWDEFWMWWESE